MLHLTRVSAALAAVANVWFVILWTRGLPLHEPGAEAWRDRPLAWLLAGGAAIGMGLYTFGAGINDVLDVRRDRALRRERPLPAGLMPLRAAVLVAFGALLAAVLGSMVFGSQAGVATLVVALAILLFNGVGKFVPGLGLALLGFIYAGHMLVVNPGLEFVWPVWLVMTHALVLAALGHVLAGRTPRISPRAWLAALLGWLGWSALLLVDWGRSPVSARELWPGWVSPWAMLAPIALVALLTLQLVHRVRRVGGGQRAADKLGRYGSLWMPFYATAWLAGAGLIDSAFLMTGVGAVGVVGTLLLRDFYAILEHPIGYRRD
jgi:4-hydroxybenzoate polyprenyltransferase